MKKNYCDIVKLYAFCAN